MSQDLPRPEQAPAYTVRRVFAGQRTIEEIVAALVRVHGA